LRMIKWDSRQLMNGFMHKKLWVLASRLRLLHINTLLLIRHNEWTMINLWMNDSKNVQVIQHFSYTHAWFAFINSNKNKRISEWDKQWYQILHKYFKLCFYIITRSIKWFSGGTTMRNIIIMINIAILLKL
jgi:hypothetical protein